jgi:hypothetical protein
MRTHPKMDPGADSVGTTTRGWACRLDLLSQSLTRSVAVALFIKLIAWPRENVNPHVLRRCIANHPFNSIDASQLDDSKRCDPTPTEGVSDTACSPVIGFQQESVRHRGREQTAIRLKVASSSIHQHLTTASCDDPIKRELKRIYPVLTNSCILKDWL